MVHGVTLRPAVLLLGCLLLTLTACARRPAPTTTPGDVPRRPQTISAAAPGAVVQPGLEVFLAHLPRSLRGARVGLITNHSAIDR